MNDHVTDTINEAAPFGYSALIFIVAFMTKHMNVLFFAYLMLMVIDYATGLLSAFINGTWNSKRGLKGILKKFGYIIMVILGFFIDLVILEVVHVFNEGFTFEAIKNISFGSLLLVFLCGNEFVSILENLKLCDIRIPSWIIAICKKIRDMPNTVLNQEKYKNVLDEKSSSSTDNNISIPSSTTSIKTTSMKDKNT